MAIKDKLRSAALRQEVRRSPIHDLREMSQSRGRLFPADTDPIAFDLAPPVPRMNGIVDLDGNPAEIRFTESKVSVLTLNMSGEGARLIHAYKQLVPANIPLFDIHVIVGWLRSIFLSRLCRRQLRQSTTVDLWQKTFCLSINKPGLFGNIGAWNRYGGYVYLVDQRGRARWRASGEPDQQDLINFSKAIEHLSNCN